MEQNLGVLNKYSLFIYLVILLTVLVLENSFFYGWVVFHFILFFFIFKIKKISGIHVLPILNPPPSPLPIPSPWAVPAHQPQENSSKLHCEDQNLLSNVLIIMTITIIIATSFWVLTMFKSTLPALSRYICL